MEKPKMKEFIGVKILKASDPITKKEYCEYRGWKVPENEDPNALVRLVEYAPDPLSKPNHENHEGYVSMSPVHVFDEAYRKTNGMTFGLAIEATKANKLVARLGWNGKGMFLFYVPNHKLDTTGNTAGIKEDIYDMDDFIAMSTVGKTFTPWLPSQSDMLAEDWFILD